MPVKDQGVFTERYQIIPRVLIFATRGNEILLIKGAPTKRLWANLYNGVGGHIEKGENILRTAHREFKEETGVNLIDPWLCANIVIDTGEPIGIGMYVFRGDVGKGELINSNEGELKWISQDNLKEIPLVEDLPILIPKILSLEPKTAPLFIDYHYDGEDELVINFNEN